MKTEWQSVPKEPDNYKWYMDFIEYPPFRIIRGDGSFVVIDNPERNFLKHVGAGGVKPCDITSMCERFLSEDEARSFLRFKNAEFLYKAMLATAPKPEPVETVEGLEEAVRDAEHDYRVGNTVNPHDFNDLIKAARLWLRKQGE